MRERIRLYQQLVEASSFNRTETQKNWKLVGAMRDFIPNEKTTEELKEEPAFSKK